MYKLLNKLQELDYEIVYCPGKLNNTADFLSRDINETREHSENTSTSEIKQIELNNLELSFEVDWEKEQQNDKEIALARLNLENKNLVDWRDLPNYKLWRKNVDNFFIDKYVLKLKTKDNDTLIVVPNRLRLRICQAFHDSISGGHLGFEKTFKSIIARFYWPGMKTDIYDYCESCDVCQKFKPKNYKWPLIGIKPEKPWNLT